MVAWRAYAALLACVCSSLPPTDSNHCRALNYLNMPFLLLFLFAYVLTVPRIYAILNAYGSYHLLPPATVFKHCYRCACLLLP